MNDTITDVIIHTSQQLDDAQFAEVCKQVYKEDGVVSLSRNVHTPRFLMAVYNAARTRSVSILNAVRQQGYEATLVGI